MKKSLIYSLLFGMLICLGAGELIAQNVKVDRWVMGSGGFLEAKNSSNQTMSGLVGQFAIEKISGTYSGKPLDIWQGFWIPTSLTPTGIHEGPDLVASEMVNVPNPISTSTMVKYTLPGSARVTLRIYNVSGKLVKTLFDGQQEAGPQQVAWDANDAYGQEVSSGSYMCELSVNPAQMAGSESFQAYTLHNVMIVVK
jgi:hypothetical protein